MKKFIKIFFKSILILLLVIIAALIIIPAFFKEDIMIKVKDEINKSVRAEVEFSDFSLSLFRNFPDFTLKLDDLTVKGVDQFEQDTLMAFKSFMVQVDLVSAIKKNVDVKGIVLDKPRIHAIVLEDSTANWDIAVEAEPSDEVEAEVAEETDTTESEAPDIQVALKKFEIKEAVIIYEDYTSNMYASIEDLNFILMGDFALDYSDLELKTSIDAINVKMDGIRYLKDATFFFKTIIGADIANNVFTLKENMFGLNALELGFNGQVAMVEEDINIDLEFATNQPTFKSLLSMVPSIFLEGLEDLETDGQLSISGNIKGTMNDTQTPNANINLNVKDAYFKYPDLPESVNDINIDLAVFYDGVNDDNTKVDLNTFHFELGDNPFDIEMHVSTPMSDPRVDGKVVGNIILGSLADAIPMEDMSIDGEIGMDLEIAGNYSSIENEKYDEFKADGHVTLDKFQFESSDLPDKVTIDGASILFSPEYVNLESFTAVIGESDFSFTGKIESYLGYVMADETVKGEFTFASDNLNANQFISETEEGEETATPEEEVQDTVSSEMGVLEIPGNIDVKLNLTLKHVLYDKLEIDNLTGALIIRDQKVQMDNLNMQILDGTIGVDGVYNAQDLEKPTVDMGLDIQDMEIETAVLSFSMLDTLAPILKKCKGKVSITFDYVSLLDQSMSPVLNSIDGYGRLQSESIEVTDSDVITKLFDKLNLTEDNNTFKDINISFSVKDGRIHIEPFDVNAGDAKMVVDGSHGLDQTMDYNLDMTIPREMMGSAANELVDGLLGEVSKKGLNVDLGDNIKIKARIYGDMNDPKIGFGKSGDSGSATQSATDQVKEKVTEEITKKKEELVDDAREEASERADKLIADAEAESAKIKKEARELADKTIADGEKEADKLVEEAAKKGALAKIAAQKTADVLKKEAQKKADNIIAEADKKADKIVADAKVEAEKIRNE